MPSLPDFVVASLKDLFAASVATGQLVVFVGFAYTAPLTAAVQPENFDVLSCFLLFFLQFKLLLFHLLIFF